MNRYILPGAQNVPKLNFQRRFLKTICNHLNLSNIDLFLNLFFLILQSFFGLQFGQNADIDIILENQDERKMGEIKDENGRKERMYLFYDGESLSGKV